ncbi:MAG: ribonuclease H [Bacteroidales bacterium]|jgi:ribonuclease HI|nr:ribonuclease H [Bacteroidales bacterium]
MKNNKFYTVWIGRVPGVYQDWETCSEQVNGFKGAKYKSFPSLQEAEAAFQAGPDNYFIKELKQEKASWKTLAEGRPEANSISVDAACSGNPGVMEYRGVYTETGTEIFHQGPFQKATNNIGEFLAIVHALAWLKKNDLELPVYTDSRTAIIWLKNKEVKTKLVRTEENEKVFELIQRALYWLDTNHYNVLVMKWNTNLWGENPADFGRKS